MPSWRQRSLPALLLVAGGLLLAGSIVAEVVVRISGRGQRPGPSSAPPTITAQASTTSRGTTTPPASAHAISWRSAGAFVWHETDIDPVRLGAAMRANGFGWVAVRSHDGLNGDPVDPGWIARFREASGLPVGGWGVLRDRPEQEAQLASSLIRRYGLDFYIADAEADYASSGHGPDAGPDSRSARFLRVFRALRPGLPAGLSSYCRLDIPGLDPAAWRDAGFVFLPQAYVDQFGPAVAPDVCVRAAAPYFPSSDVHPTLGTFSATMTLPSPAEYAQLLKQAGTVGFSLYLAETNMPDTNWRAWGQAISQLGIAVTP